MELLLDTANLDRIGKALEYYPISGLTTNPSIISKEGNIDLFEHLHRIQALLGQQRTFHVQVISNDAEGIVREAEALRKEFGNDIYIKTPVTREGLKAIGLMAKQGFNVTATAIYTTDRKSVV